MEVGLCYGVGSIERVLKRGVEGPEGEFVDYVGEVECWKKAKKGVRGLGFS